MEERKHEPRFAEFVSIEEKTPVWKKIIDVVISVIIAAFFLSLIIAMFN